MCALKSLHSINNVSENECNLITATWHLLVNTMQIHFNPFCFMVSSQKWPNTNGILYCL